MSRSKHLDKSVYELQAALFIQITDFRAGRIRTPAGLQLLKTYAFKKMKNIKRDEKDDVFSYLLTSIFNSTVEITERNTFAFLRHRILNAMEETGHYIPHKNDPDTDTTKESRYKAGRQIKPVPVDINLYSEQAAYYDKSYLQAEFRADWERQLGHGSINWDARTNLY